MNVRLLRKSRGVWARREGSDERLGKVEELAKSAVSCFGAKNDGKVSDRVVE